ncbi:hypothetical protein CGLO_00055 [Colletotrichum gloeosporioides Cg-14]|uniref:Uncharacterized protein n=1 Tax=Colletotrichum gloeosporioides (strain Cg-14) TaxID=1237896 RepID=T0M864_COLGC|nr:hypothetical protein CGLO_00055 [Colletotrichum gloeosporioides Cg-14]
MIRTSSSS